MTEAESNRSVLFVDDEPNVLVALQRLLIDERFEVRTCADPVSALEMVKKEPPQVVVADYYMPRMNGPKLLAEVRDFDDTIVRIMMTGKPDVTAVLDSVGDGAVYRFILKPWDEDELRMALRQAFAHRKLTAERDDLQDQLKEHTRTIERLEEKHPGITKLPERDASGAFVLTMDDLPDGGG